MRKLSSMIKMGLVSSVVAIGMSGCIPAPAPQATSKQDVGTLSFKYTFKNKKARVNKKIAIVAPKFSDISARKTEGANFNALLGDYMGRLSKAMSSGFEELILTKGFTIGGKHKTFDDMTYPERKSTYMSLVPTIEITIDKKVTSQDKHMSYYTEKGIMQVSGELIVKMIEPLSKQMFISKRIDLSDLDIKKEYTYENKLISKKSGSSGGGLIGSLLDSAIKGATTPDKMSNNMDKVLTEALNEFYTKAMGKIDKYISQEEILALEKDVNSAKGKTGGSW
jgi:neuraminyllactose-binding hemagglutinin